MHQHDSNTPDCAFCGGFPVVAIATGARHRDGSRVLLRVVCRGCQGTGHGAPARRREAARV
ncbi:hypothetical protein [Streptomyces phaeochromogenes]|uniref:hypothetical protein n=1 Tax=Streptomyces phaeochromogenes TaxID=1923 RepID=UPI00386C348B|nr:hypothetical protein OG277_23720 [Streptomyces phaeochromogenes]